MMIDPRKVKDKQGFRLICQAMSSPDDWVIELSYTDTDGAATRRMVSPIRFLDEERFLGLCLCREEPRQFALERCADIRLEESSNVLMPVPIEEIA